MANLALLIYLTGYDFRLMDWGSKILPQEVYAIVDTGNTLLWICEGKAGKANRRMSDSWTQSILEKKISLEPYGIRELPKEVVKVETNIFEKILALPHQPAGEFLVRVSIPPPAQLLTSDKDLIQTKEPRIITKEPSKALIGMIKLHRTIDVNRAAKLLLINPDEVRVLLYSLAADDKIKGEFDGETFRIISDVDEFVAALDQQFRQWGKGEAGGQGKVQ